jgi:hypothetical protein
VAQADQALGRFRTFLLTVLDRFVISESRRASAKKRAAVDRAGVDPQQLDAHAAHEDRPGAAFDVEWARQVLAATLRQMEAECRSSGRPDIWGVFEGRVLGPTLEGSPPCEYPELVERFGLKSPSQASNALITAKRMFRRNLEAVVGQYAASPAEVQEEIRDLWSILSAPGAGSR